MKPAIPVQRRIPVVGLPTVRTDLPPRFHCPFDDAQTAVRRDRISRLNFTDDLLSTIRRG